MSPSLPSCHYETAFVFGVLRIGVMTAILAVKPIQSR
jgi:hypothetical protein